MIETFLKCQNRSCWEMNSLFYKIKGCMSVIRHIFIEIIEWQENIYFCNRYIYIFVYLNEYCFQETPDFL